MRNVFYPLVYPTRKRQILRRWRKKGRPDPPPAYYKHDLLKQVVATHSHLEVFVETGTWKADTLFQLRNSFQELHSIELNSKLYEAARKRLSRQKQIHLWQGHSPEVLPRILSTLSSPTLFWLDAHYMGGPQTGHGVCPVIAELSAIFTYLQQDGHHMVLIDDARNFIAAGDYPSLSQVADHVKKHWPDYDVAVQTDIIFVKSNR
ncbi:MAG: hypothetical protein AAGD96_05465 [Chloroflexota bacterium]